MDTVFNCEFKVNDNDITTEILLWKCANPLSMLTIDVVGENVVCNIETMYDTRNNSLVYGSTSINEDFSSIEHKTITTFLSLMNIKSTKKRSVPMIIDEEFEIIDD